MADCRKPTVVAAGSFNADHDAEALNEAYKDCKANKSVIISTMSGRSLEQRQSIRDAYISKYEKGIIHDLRSQVSDNYCSLLDGLLDDATEFHAKHLHRIVNNILAEGKDVELLEVLFPLSAIERFVIGCSYSELYKKSLLEDIKENIKENISGAFKKTVVSLLQDEASEENPSSSEIREYVDILAAVTSEEWNPANNKLIEIFCSSTLVSLASVTKDYKSKTNKSLLDVVTADAADEFRRGFQVMIGAADDIWQYFADQIYESASGPRLNINKLIYIVIFRCEMDLANISEVFQKTYDRSLHDFLRQHCSDDYTDMLLALVGPEKK